MCIKEIAKPVIKKIIAVFTFLIMSVDISFVVVTFVVALPWFFVRGQFKLDAKIALDLIKEHWFEGIEISKNLWRGE